MAVKSNTTKKSRSTIATYRPVCKAWSPTTKTLLKLRWKIKLLRSPQFARLWRIMATRQCCHQKKFKNQAIQQRGAAVQESARLANGIARATWVEWSSMRIVVRIWWLWQGKNQALSSSTRLKIAVAIKRRESSLNLKNIIISRATMSLIRKSAAGSAAGSAASLRRPAWFYPQQAR